MTTSEKAEALPAIDVAGEFRAVFMLLPVVDAGHATPRLSTPTLADLSALLSALSPSALARVLSPFLSIPQQLDRLEVRTLEAANEQLASTRAEVERLELELHNFKVILTNEALADASINAPIRERLKRTRLRESAAQARAIAAEKELAAEKDAHGVTQNRGFDALRKERARREAAELVLSELLDARFSPADDADGRGLTYRVHAAQWDKVRDIVGKKEANPVEAGERCEEQGTGRRPPEPPDVDDDKNPREPGCLCHWEEGDSPCPVHGEEEPTPAHDAKADETREAMSAGSPGSVDPATREDAAETPSGGLAASSTQRGESGGRPTPTEAELTRAWNITGYLKWMPIARFVAAVADELARSREAGREESQSTARAALEILQQALDLEQAHREWSWVKTGQMYRGAVQRARLKLAKLAGGG